MSLAHDATKHVAQQLLDTAQGAGSTGRKIRARFHPLTVSEVRPLTDSSVEVTFAVPCDLQDRYQYLAGQYVALRATVDGEELRRSYSLCRPPQTESLSVAIKRDLGGRFSTWAQSELRAGDTVDVMSPQGGFTSRIADFDAKHVVALAAGSGITPVMALAATILARSDSARFTLLYTNKSSIDVMFANELADLKDRYPERLVLHHVLSREQRSAPLLSGRLDEDRLRRILTALIRPATVDEWFLCGPYDLVQLCRGVLDDLGVDAASVRYELFTTGREQVGAVQARPVVVRAGEEIRTIAFSLDGQSSTVESPVAARETILSAALRVRADVPFACSGGVCGTCRARVIHGAVTMTENYALEPSEVERGYVLTCQSHPTTESISVDYDV